MEKDRQLKLAIIGLGHAASYQLEALKLTAGWRLAATCDLDESRKEIIGARDVPFFLDYRKMLAEVDADAVLVSTPYLKHYEIAKEVLAARKNLLVEKPATATIEELNELISIAETQKVVFSVALHAAYGKELVWFTENYHGDLKQRLGNITGFQCGFYDPYIVEGKLQDRAKSLGTSWMDSGINALSVVGRLVRNLEVTEGRFTYIRQYEIDDVQAAVDFCFATEDSDRSGRGTIETNWTLGINRKMTNLVFAQRGTSVVLDHSDQKVVRIDACGNAEMLVDYSKGLPRMTNHYLGVFNDYYKEVKEKSNNIGFALPLHRLLYAAYSKEMRISELP